ncbi:ABC transporter permease [Candidatus Woesearchaeota archaeon]|nr:ABC transporter permease [Candidatus Woesearchaeota archaeon]
MFKDYFTIPFKEMKRRKLRSLLTLVGVFIGIASVISLISLGQGLEEAIGQHIQSLGKDKLFINAKGNSLTAGLSLEAIKITDKDLKVVKSTSGVKKAAGMIYTTAGIEFNDISRYAFVMGLPTISDEVSLINEAQSYKIMRGRQLDTGDKYRVVVGYEYSKKERYEKEIELGDNILVNGKELKVVGIMQKIGSPPDDQSIIIPIEIYWELFGGKDTYGMLIAQAQASEEPDIVAERLEKELREERGLEEGKEDLEIKSAEQFAASFASILDIVQVVLVGIASISLLVGGVGIMNTMYTAVLQRTKEIGLMKAVGAKNNHILFLFLVESGFYGLGGGIVGVILGIGFAKIVEAIFVQLIGPLLVIKISWGLVIFVLLFSFIVGCLSGIAPAWRASKLNPVESLRYE